MHRVDPDAEPALIEALAATAGVEKIDDYNAPAGRPAARSPCPFSRINPASSASPTRSPGRLPGNDMYVTLMPQ
jgi:hypothetical protein